MTDISISRFLATTALYLRSLAPASPGSATNQGKREGYRPLKARRVPTRQAGVTASTRSQPGILRSTAASGDMVDSLRASRPLVRGTRNASFGMPIEQAGAGDFDWPYRGDLEAVHECMTEARSAGDLYP
jgi:hypothetical protein